MGKSETDPRGRAASSRLAELQRARILGAMIEICALRGASDVTVSGVVARAGVSRRTFYELFADREDCLVAATAHAIELVCGRMSEGYAQHGRWHERVRAGLLGGLRALDEHPDLARLVVVESLRGGGRVMELRSRVLARLAEAVDAGREEAPNTRMLPPLLAQGTVGAVLSLLYARLTSDDGPTLELTNALMGMVVLPYLGPAAARRELERAAPEAVPTRAVSSPPAERIQMRLTYRTMRVLGAIGEHPGASNRKVADIAGLRDQGQTSKLLHRLERLGLIENAGEAPTLGAPNAWQLTAKGAALRNTLDLGRGSPVAGTRRNPRAGPGRQGRGPRTA